MDRMILSVVLADNADTSRARRIGKILAAGVQATIDDLIATGLVQRGEFIATPEPCVHLEGPRGQAATQARAR